MKRTPATRSLNRRVRPDNPGGGQHHLDVRVRRSTARRQRTNRLTRFLVGAILWIGIGTTTWFGFLAVTEKFFLTNPEYALQHVVVESGGLMTEEEVMDLTGITLGTNIFQIDLGSAERALREIQQIETVRIARDWPASISILITKHEPVAWLARSSAEAFRAEGNLLVTLEGRLMTPYKIEPDYWHLPVIYCADPDLVASGDTLAVADLQAALTLLAEHRRYPRSLLEIRSIDITKGYAFEITNDANAKILFAPGDPASQLERLEKLLQHCHETGRQLDTVNLIPKKFTPVKFLLAASQETVTEPETPAQR